MSVATIEFSHKGIGKRIMPIGYNDYYTVSGNVVGSDEGFIVRQKITATREYWDDEWLEPKLRLQVNVWNGFESVNCKLKYFTESIESSDYQTLYNKLGSEGETLVTFDTTINRTIAITVEDRNIIKNILKNGLAIISDGEDWHAYGTVRVQPGNLEYIDENANPVANWIPENMTGGKFKEGSLTAFEQDINEPFVLAWSYTQEAGVAVDRTEIKINRKDNGEGSQEYTITDVSYTGNTGSVVVPNDIWRRIPCELAATITVYSAKGKTGTKRLTVAVPYQGAEITYPEKDTQVKHEIGTTLRWETTRPAQFETYPEISGYRVLLSTNEGATYDVGAEITGDNREYVFEQNTLPVGVVYCRVQVLYVNNTIPQNIEYGENRFIVKADPGTSTVTCDGKPIPTVRWYSVAQTAYQVRFGEYDSGAVYSGDTQHKVPYIFADGVYEVTVRTQINTGEWSEWTAPIYVQITNVPLGAGITAAASVEGYRVRITWTKKTAYQDYIVYRNGTPIHVTDGGSATEGGYMDRTANGVTVYTVRGVASSGYYDETEPVTVDAAANTDVLVIIGTDEIIPLRYTQTFPKKHGYVADMPVTYRYFAGREKPIAIMSGQIERTIPLSYADKGRELARKITKCLGKTVMFKDTGGDTITGILGQVEASMGRVSVTTFQITEVDYNEQVEYIPRE